MHFTFVKKIKILEVVPKGILLNSIDIFFTCKYFTLCDRTIATRTNAIFTRKRNYNSNRKQIELCSRKIETKNKYTYEVPTQRTNLNSQDMLKGLINT